MTNYAFTSGGVTDPSVLALNAGDSLHVGSQAEFIARADICAYVNGGNVQVTVAGTVAGSFGGIALGIVDGLAGSSDDCSLTILSGGNVLATTLNRYAVLLSGTGHNVLNAGTISGTFGISAGFFDNNGADGYQIDNSGAVLGGNAGMVLLASSGSITNSGNISSGDSHAFNSAGDLGQLLGGICAIGHDVVVGNSGTITSTSLTGYGIAIAGTGTVVTNSGHIATNSTEANRAAVDLITLNATDSANLINSATGHIVSNATAVQGNVGIETVVNRGEIVGDVLLGGANDVFDGPGGTVLGNIDGGGGNDRLTGGVSDDYIIGGPGIDKLTGNGGSDTFIFSEAGKKNNDTVTDFQHRVDFIDLDHTFFSHLPVGDLSSSMLRVGSAAVDANDHLIYNSDGQLLYDADANGTAKIAVVICTLAGHPTLTASDIDII